MKAKHYLPILTFTGAMFFGLSLAAETMDHSMMHHEDHGEMQHDTHQSMPSQDASSHSQHDVMEHHGAASEHQNHAGMMEQGTAEHDMHSQHGAMQHTGGEHHAKSNSMAMESSDLPRLQAMPSSGKSREAGFDGRYVMESTSAQASVATRCAQASRGLVMVDNATWAECGGKPQGWSKGIGDRANANMNTQPAMDHSQHMGH